MHMNDNQNQNIEIETTVLALGSSVLDINTTSIVTPRKQGSMLLMAVLGVFVIVPLQRILTNYKKIGVAITTLLLATLLVDLWRIDTQELKIAEDWFKFSFLYGFVFYLIFQAYDIVNILNGKYKDMFGNILHKE